MATVTHIIRSHYDPADREQLERETGQRTDTDGAGPSSDPWQTESSFSAHRRIRAPPTFVPATISYDEWGAPIPLPSSKSGAITTASAGAGTESREPAYPSTSSAAWYRTLTAATATKPPRESPIADTSPAQPSSSSSSPRAHKHTKQDWFIHNVLRSDPSLSHTPPGGSGPSAAAPSLADLLARDPPPLPGQSRYTPPVWLHIGPSNKGFGMLQRSGWQEGEGLGAHVARRGNAASSTTASPPVKVEDHGERIDQAHAVIDLTRSDSEVSEDEDVFEEDAVRSDPAETEAATNANGDTSASHMPKSLLTPLPTVLKADRLGIGLKAKTEGPYKQSKKRVTHNAAALAAHIRAAEEMRRKQAEAGRGRRGFSKAHKREEDRRKKMLAYLNE
ncbi:hypothetical protein JVU11DRAFT_3431 [Chiua virens]|nr:hypothetical protein JVU11DRAFT_3431 [Chiua virens]